MSREAWAYVAGGAGEGATMRHNRAAFERWRVVPRMLHGTRTRDLSTSVLGTPLCAPVMVAPVGAGALVRPDSDVHIARGAAMAGVTSSARISSSVFMPSSVPANLRRHSGTNWRVAGSGLPAGSSRFLRPIKDFSRQSA